MDYKLIIPAVEKILSEAKTSKDGDFGWANPASQLSRTVTAQVIITLSKCAEFETDQTRRKKILESIEKGFVYLKKSLLTGNSELPTYAFTLIAHLEHHDRHPSIHNLDPQLISNCVEEIKNPDFYFAEENAFTYANEIERKFFATYLVAQSFLRLLDTIEKNPSLAVKNVTKDILHTDIDNCFKYIFVNKLPKKIKEKNDLEFDALAEFLSIGIQISKYYEDYSKKYNRIQGITNPENNLNTAIDYFVEHLEANVYNHWFIQIRRTPFILLYVSNLISGLLKYRGQLSEKGVKLLYSLANFICSDERIQMKDRDGNILYTKLPGAPVWGTAHALNAILKIECSLNELKWINSKPEVAQPQKSEPQLRTPIFNFSDFGKSFFSYVILPIFTGLISSLIFTKYLSANVDTKNYLLVSLILLGVSLSVYFVPKILFKFLARTFTFFEKHERTLATFGYILMIVAYVIIIYHYTFNSK